MSEYDGSVKIGVEIEIEKLRKQVDALVKSMAGMEKEFSSVNASIDKLEKSQNGLLKTQSQIAETSQRTAEAAGEMQKHFREERDAIEELTASTERLEKATEIYEATLDGIEKGIGFAKDIDGIDELTEAQTRLNETVKAYTEFRASAGDSADAKVIAEKKKKIDELRGALKKAEDSHKSLEKESRKLSTQLRQFAKDLAAGKVSLEQMSHAMHLIQPAGMAIAAVFGQITSAINQCMEAYRAQAAAETALETAAKNNPYLDGRGVKALKEFASHVQSYSTMGDEQLLPLMAKLAASGRTQKEIQDIITASVDIASAGAMSLESAVNNLNKTFGGLSGELGESVPAVKSLTAEELKAGKAVEVVASQYKDMARAVAESTGTAQQLRNATSDLQESIGSGWEEKTAPMRIALKGIVQELTAAINKSNEARKSFNLFSGNDEGGYIKNQKADQKAVENARRQAMQEKAAWEKVLSSGNASDADYASQKIKELESAIDEYNKRLADISDQIINANQNIIAKLSDEELTAGYEKLLMSVTDRQSDAFIEMRKAFAESAKVSGNAKINFETNTDFSLINDETLAYAKEQLELFRKEIEGRKIEIPVTVDADAGAAVAEADAYEKLLKSYKDRLRQSELELEFRKKNGEFISEEEEAQARLAAQTSALLNFEIQAAQLFESDAAMRERHGKSHEKLLDGEIKKAGELGDAYTAAFEKAESFRGLVSMLEDAHAAASAVTKQHEDFLKNILEENLTISQNMEMQEASIARQLASMRERLKLSDDAALNEDIIKTACEEQGIAADSMIDVYRRLSQEQKKLAASRDLQKSSESLKATIDDTNALLDMSAKLIAEMRREETLVYDAAKNQTSEIDRQQDILREKIEQLKTAEGATGKSADDVERETAEYEKQIDLLEKKKDAIAAASTDVAISESQKIGSQFRPKTKRQQAKETVQKVSSANRNLMAERDSFSSGTTSYDKEIAEIQKLKEQKIISAEDAAEKIKLIEEKKADKLTELNREIGNSDRDLFSARAAYAEACLSDIVDIVNQAAQVASQMLDIWRNNIEAQADEERTALSKEYNDGVIDYEEYCERKKQIEQKAAREKYKVELAQWGMNLLTATANAALGVTSALAAPWPVNLVSAIAAGVAGAAAVATVAANKPKPPSFATGGVVGGFRGASMGGDNTTANVRNGEMILNAQQQKQLWQTANGNGGGETNVQMNVKVINNAADSVRTSQQIDNNQLTMTIDKIVNKSMADGKYNSSMSIGQQKTEGEKWL